MFLFSVTFVLTSCHSKKNSLDENNLKGQVVKVYQNTFNAVEKFGKWELGEKEFYGNSVMLFNDDGYLSEYIRFDRQNTIEERQVFTYDDGVLLEIAVYDNSGNEISKIKYEKDKENRTSKIKHYDPDATVNFIYEFEYEDGEKPTRGKRLNKDGKVTSLRRNDWEGDDLKIQIHYDSINRLDSKTYFERNKYSDVITQRNTNRNDSVISLYKFEYEYDDHENWVKQTVYYDEKISSFVTRKIIYFTGKRLNANALIGIWKEVDDNNWIEFKKDGTYDKGYNENIRDFGKWELNEENKTLTFKSDDPAKSKKYSFSYEEQKMILSTLSGKERVEFEKK